MSDIRTAAEDIRYAAALLQFISEGKFVLPSELRAAARRLRKIAQVYWGSKISKG